MIHGEGRGDEGYSCCGEMDTSAQGERERERERVRESERECV